MTIKNDDKTLRFSVIVLRNGETLFEIPNWRIFNGHLTPPSWRDGKGRYWPLLLMNDTDLRTLERWITQQWAPQFPSVTWSQLEESKGV